MSGGLAVKAKKRGVVRAGAERGEATTRPAFFCPQGLALTAGGRHAPKFKRTNSAEG